MEGNTILVLIMVMRFFLRLAREITRGVESSRSLFLSPVLALLQPYESAP